MTITKYPGLSAGKVGAIGELRVSADLLEKGYDVFRAVSQSAPCDLLAMKHGTIKRIEVRTAHYGKGDAIYYCKKVTDVGKSDHYAAVLPDQIVYLPPL